MWAKSQVKIGKFDFTGKMQSYRKIIIKSRRPNEHCYAELNQNSTTSHIDEFNFNNKFLCDNTLSSQLTFNQFFDAPRDNHYMTLKVYCNKNQCNQQTTVEEVYNIFQSNFTLPLNYSQYIPEPNGSYRINDFISFPVFLFLYIFLN